MTATRITRTELYELVWRTPMSRLAAEFGISDVALAKMCKRLSVPRPGRGYWAKLASGMKVVKRPPLGKLEAGMREWTSVARSDRPTAPLPTPKVPKVPVPTDLRDALEAIKGLGLALHISKKDQHGRLVVPGAGSPVFAVTVAVHRRALLILAGLASALNERGHRLVFRDDDDANSLSIVLGDQPVAISVLERLEPTEHALTLEEQRTVGTAHEYGGPKHDYVADGRLQIIIHDTRGVRASWSDTKTRKLEQHLGSVIVAAEHEALRRREQRRAEEERRKEEARRRAAEEEERRRQHLRESRAQHQQRLATDLRQMARAWSEAEEIRSFLRATRDALPVTALNEGTAQWLRWAEAYVLLLDPLSEPNEVAKELDPDIDR